jgi:hypothetical protein
VLAVGAEEPGRHSGAHQLHEMGSPETEPHVVV